MPVSREILARLLENAGTARDRLLVLLVTDLDKHAIDPSSLHISDIDVPSKLLRIKGDNQSIDRAKLSSATISAFHQYISHRTSQDQTLFLDDNGKPETIQYINGILGQIAERTGIHFDPTTSQFNEPRKDKLPRIATPTASKDMFYLYGIVSHPLRRKIVEILGDEGPTSFTTLKKRTEAKVGTLYYHLDMLKGLVSQDSQKKYVLTTTGNTAYTKLQSSEYVENTAELVRNIPSRTGPLEKIAGILTLTRLWPALSSDSILPKIGAIPLIALGAILVYQARLETVLLFFNPVLARSLLLPVEFIAGWIITYAIADFVATLPFHRRGEHLTLFLATGYALTPLLAFTVWWNLVVFDSVRTPLVSTVAFSRILLIILQAWALAMLAFAVSTVKGLRLERAAVVSLAVAYANVLVAYLRGV
jgi:hypothetical protein